MPTKSILPDLVAKHEKDLSNDWMREQMTAVTRRSDLMSEETLKQDSNDFLAAFREAIQSRNLTDIAAPEWRKVIQVLDRVAGARAKIGFSPAENATFVFSLKQPLFGRLRKEITDADTLFAELWAVTTLLDKLGLYTTETFQKERESVILRQQEEMMELSTPVVKLWDGILALPMIGTLDSARTQVVMETLLQRIVETGSEVAILDITGVPTVDTLVAQHLIKTVTAARLMGAECIISGIRPQIASTIVHLGVDLAGVVTKASLADAFKIALQKIGKKNFSSQTEGPSVSSAKAKPTPQNFAATRSIPMDH
jgi:rsbT co-antagonist protein RsbR